MKAGLYLAIAVAIATVSEGDISGSDPVWGACLCIDGGPVNIRSSPCGSKIGSGKWGDCYRYTGYNQWCYLDSDGRYHRFFRLQYFGRDGYVAGELLAYGNGC